MQLSVTNGVRVPQLPAHSLCLSRSKPTCAADGAPLSITVHLHSPLWGVATSHQPNLECIGAVWQTSRVCRGNQCLDKSHLLNGDMQISKSNIIHCSGIYMYEVLKSEIWTSNTSYKYLWQCTTFCHVAYQQSLVTFSHIQRRETSHKWQILASLPVYMRIERVHRLAISYFALQGANDLCVCVCGGGGGALRVTMFVLAEEEHSHMHQLHWRQKVFIYHWQRYMNLWAGYYIKCYLCGRALHS